MDEIDSQPTLTTYKEYFEVPLIDAAKTYYAGESATMIENRTLAFANYVSGQAYMVHVLCG